LPDARTGAGGGNRRPGVCASSAARPAGSDRIAARRSPPDMLVPKTEPILTVAPAPAIAIAIGAAG
jgi:hypothetical protein